MPERFPSKVRDPTDNTDPHKIGRREPRAEYLGWLHCRQINEIVDHCAWMSSQADSRVAYPGRTLVFLANCYTRNRVIQHSFCAASLACLLTIPRPDASPGRTMPGSVPTKGELIMGLALACRAEKKSPGVARGLNDHLLVLLRSTSSFVWGSAVSW